MRVELDPQKQYKKGQKKVGEVILRIGGKSSWLGGGKGGRERGRVCGVR